MFSLNPGLTRSATLVLDLPLSTVLLKDDVRWPWLILVPRIFDVRDLGELLDADAIQLMREIGCAARAVTTEPGVERSNVGALGNIVPQLHVHVVGRWPGDPAWPGPVWGVEGKVAYASAERSDRIARLKKQLVLS
jgi:diadenosine tetraphosphate (Ap4A) HIT family hydrolase